MEWTGITGTVNAFVPAKHGTAETAGIEKGIQFTIFVARDEDRLPPHGTQGSSQKVALVEIWLPWAR